MFAMKGRKMTIIVIIIIIVGLTAGLLSYFMVSGHGQSKSNTHRFDICSNAVVEGFAQTGSDAKYQDFVKSHPHLVKPPKMAYCSPSGDRYLKGEETDDGQYDVVDMIIYEYDKAQEHATSNNGKYEIKAQCLKTDGGQIDHIRILRLDYIYDDQHFSFM